MGRRVGATIAMLAFLAMARFFVLSRLVERDTARSHVVARLGDVREASMRTQVAATAILASATPEHAVPSDSLPGALAQLEASHGGLHAAIEVPGGASVEASAAADAIDGAIRAARKALGAYARGDSAVARDGLTATVRELDGARRAVLAAERAIEEAVDEGSAHAVRIALVLVVVTLLILWALWQWATRPAIEAAKHAFSEADRAHATLRAHAAEQAVAASIVHADIDGIFVLDRALHITEWNPTMERWSGIPRDGAIGRHLDQLIPVDEPAERRNDLLRSLSTGVGYRRERVYRFSAMEQSLVVESIVTPLPSEVGGVAEGVVCTIRDISERRAAESAIQRERERFMEAINAIDSGFLIFDAERRVQAANMAMRSLLPPDATTSPIGVPLEDLLRGLLIDGHHPVTGEDGDVWVARAVHRHDTHQGVFEEVFAVPVRGWIAPMSDGGRAVMFTDISALKAIQASLEHARDEARAADHAKSAFLARMSHELRTPLNSIIGFSRQVLRTGGERLSDRDRLYLERVLHNGTHLLTLINDILDLSKIEAGRMAVTMAPTDIGALVTETVTLLEGQVRSPEVSLRAEVPARLARIVTDETQLRQVLINLVGNALKFTQRGSVRICVECDPSGHATAIRVADTGIGIPRDRLEAVFEAFEQAEASTSRRFGGTGLGLSISRSICQQLGMSLHVESRVGEGSTFTIRLPAAA